MTLSKNGTTLAVCWKLLFGISMLFAETFLDMKIPRAQHYLLHVL